MFWTWIEQFHDKYLNTEKVSKWIRSTYLVGHNGFEQKINADIPGQLTKSLMDNLKILKVKKLETEKHEEKDKEKELNIESISYQEENVAILLEICKFYGRDINIMEMYGLFENIIKKGYVYTKSEPWNETEKYVYNSKDEIRTMFLQALKELKYMGYLSQTKISTFIFKKNYFGKAKHQKSIAKTDQQKERDKLDTLR